MNNENNFAEELSIWNVELWWFVGTTAGVCTTRGVVTEPKVATACTRAAHGTLCQLHRAYAERCWGHQCFGKDTAQKQSCC